MRQPLRRVESLLEMATQRRKADQKLQITLTEMGVQRALIPLMTGQYPPPLEDLEEKAQEEDTRGEMVLKIMQANQ